MRRRALGFGDPAASLNVGPEAVPIGRIGKAEEFWEVMFLLLTRDGFMKGQTVGVNGGNVLYRTFPPVSTPFFYTAPSVITSSR